MINGKFPLTSPPPYHAFVHGNSFATEPPPYRQFLLAPHPMYFIRVNVCLFPDVYLPFREPSLQGRAIQVAEPRSSQVVSTKIHNPYSVQWQVMLGNLQAGIERNSGTLDCLGNYATIWTELYNHRETIPTHYFQKLMLLMFKKIGEFFLEESSEFRNIEKNNCSHLARQLRVAAADLLLKMVQDSLRVVKNTDCPSSWMEVFGRGMRCLTISCWFLRDARLDHLRRFTEKVLAFSENHRVVLDSEFVINRLRMRYLSTKTAKDILVIYHNSLLNAPGRKNLNILRNQKRQVVNEISKKSVGPFYWGNCSSQQQKEMREAFAKLCRLYET